MPDVTVVGTPTSSGSSTNSTSRATGIPIGNQAGDYAVCVLDRWFGSNTNPAVTLSGFTLIDFGSSSDNAAKIHGFYKKLSGNETGSYTASWSGSAFAVLRCIMLRNVIDIGDPIVSAMQKVSGSFGTVTSMAFSASAGDALIWAMYNDSTATHTAPTGFTKDIDVDCSALAHRIATTTGTQTAANGAASSSSPAAAIFFGFKRMPDSGSTATLAATLPEFAVDIDGQSRSSAALSAAIPALTSLISASASLTGSMTASLVAIEFDVDGVSRIVAGLVATIPQFDADFDASSGSSGAVSTLVPEFVTLLTAESRSAGALSGTLTVLTAALSGSIETEGAVFSAALPGLDASLSATARSQASLSALFPEMIVDLFGTVEAERIAVLDALLPTLGADLDAHAESAGLLNAQISQIVFESSGEFETDEYGELKVTLPMLLMAASTRRYRDMETQRALTKSFIDSNPIVVQLTPVTRTKLPSGGTTTVTGVPRPIQTFRLIPMSHTTMPTRSTSTSASADAGVQRRYDYTLLGEWDAQMEVFDYWDSPDGQRLVIEALVSYNGYEKKGLVISYGGDPAHASS